MRRVALLIVAACVLSPPAASRAAGGEPPTAESRFLAGAAEPTAERTPAATPRYEIGASLDGWIAGFGAAGVAGAIALGSSTESLAFDEIARLSREAVNRFDRVAIDKYSDGISGASWVLAGAAIAAPLALFLDGRVRDDWESVSVMYSETMALGVVVSELAKDAVRRVRPYAYRSDVPLGMKLASDARGSFFSRHSALAFASAVFLCTVYDEYHPDSDARPYLWAGSLTAAALVGYMRFESGRHFPSDIVVGAAVGSALGYFIPRLHRVEGSRLGVAPFLGGDAYGLALRFEL